MSGLPNLPPGLDPGLVKYLTKLGQQFEVTQSDRGSPLMSKPTIQDLIDIGVIRPNTNQQLQVNGKGFTLGSVTNWLSSAIPDWFTALLNPPVVAGLTVGLNASNFVLSWTAWNSTYYAQTLVYRSQTNDLSTAVSIGSTTGNTYVDNLPASGTYYYWVRNQTKSGNLSDFNAILGSTVGNIVSAPSIMSSFDAGDLILTWPTPTSALTIQYYIIRYGATFSGGIAVGVSNTNTLRISATFGGTRTFWIAAVDVNNQLGLAGSIAVAIPPPNAPTVVQTVQNASLVLNYSATAGILPVASYEIRYGASWAAGVTVAAGNITHFETSVNWTGSRTFWVAAYDTAGNVGTATQVLFSPAAPGTVTVTTQVIDNNVLLSWSAASGTLPVAYYMVDRGGTPIGPVAGRFTVIYETLAGNYTYGITAYDSAGNAGARSTATATVQQPPDFTLYSNANSTFAGTLTTCAVDAASGGLLCNVDTTETWATHFSSRGWTSIADQIAAGYPAYVVGKTSGSYVEVVDYTATIASSKATLTPTTYFASGTVTITPKLEMGVDGTTWPQSFPGVYSAFATSFRYVRYTAAFSAVHDGTGLAADTSALLVIQPLNYRLDVKQKTFQGMVSALSADVGGTPVDITGVFADVSSLTLTALSTTPLYVVYDFVDAPNPTTFKVLVFNTSGTRVSATVSYILRGV